MSETKKAESTEESDRSIDIEDQGQKTDTGKEFTSGSLSDAEGESRPGPVGVAVREATQKTGEAPTTIIDQTGHRGT